jgi:hypothetical protein
MRHHRLPVLIQVSHGSSWKDPVNWAGKQAPANPVPRRFASKTGNKDKRVRFPIIGVVDAKDYLCSVPIDHGSRVFRFR